jgi:c-di-GMP-binding flagellar brake protein YcgR
MTRLNPRERRASFRFDKVISVQVGSADFGEMSAVARNISDGGMQIETPCPLPLGSEVRIHFEIPGAHAAITARAEVKNHYSFNYNDGGQPRSARGMGVRFLEFIQDGGDRLKVSLKTLRVLH